MICNRCDGTREVVEIRLNGLVMSAPAYPHTPRAQRLKCAACNGYGIIDDDENCNDRPTYLTRDCYNATPRNDKTDADEFDSFFTDLGGEGGDSCESS